MLSHTFVLKNAAVPALYPSAIPAIPTPPVLPPLPSVPPPDAPYWTPPAQLPHAWIAFEARAAHESRGRRVLVIDDDLHIGAVVREILEDEGYTVLTAGDGREALAMLDAQAVRPDLILLDMRMQGMNGWDFAAAYRQRPGLHAPLITMTAAHNAQAWADEIGADGVLAKPFDLDELLAVVERYTSSGE